MLVNPSGGVGQRSLQVLGQLGKCGQAAAPALDGVFGVLARLSWGRSRWSKPLSMMRRRVPSPSGVRVNSTRLAFPGAASTSGLDLLDEAAVLAVLVPAHHQAAGGAQVDLGASEGALGGYASTGLYK